MLNKKELSEIVKNVSYKDWTLKVGKKDDTFYLQCIFNAPDNYTKIIEPQFCRKWQLSEFMCVSEVVRTAYKAVLAAEEHEVQEHFKYKGQLIFCPHVDVEALVEIAEAKRIDVREEI